MVNILFPASLRAGRNSLDAPTSPLGAFALFLACGGMQWNLLSGWFESTGLPLGFHKLRLHGVLPAWGIDFDLAGYGKPSQAHM